MTELFRQSYEVPAADLGRDNPLPCFREADEDVPQKLDASVPEPDRRYMGWRTAFRVLPYRMQDGYNRERKPRAFQGLVLENAHIRALFLPELGGRLASLTDKASGRELLDRNPVFQPANLALRNAWFSGGIEWNTTLPGHYYLTCSRIFAARVDGEAYPVLRLYEWDRVRCFPWQIDFHLPPDSRFLFAHVRLTNPHPVEIPMYWWTNMAVPETPQSRVLFPAATAIGFQENGLLGLVELPTVLKRDMSYATNAPHAQEMFTRIEDNQRRWVCCLDETGAGLVETSTERLKGRKMFCWGMNGGGRRWQEFLSVPGHAYIEIQAGLARTQLECIPMPAATAWSWTEAFGLLQVDAKKVHGADWQAAWRTADVALESALPRAHVDAMHARAGAAAERLPAELLAEGSGWGALERHRLERAGQPAGLLPAEAYPDATLGAEQRQWLALLEEGTLPERPPEEDPGPEMVQSEWRTLLEGSVKDGGGHWLALYHLGVMRLEAGDVEGARSAFERSAAMRPSSWAWRNLAVLAQREDKPREARELLARAWEAGPRPLHLALEYARALVDAKDYEAMNLLVGELPEAFRAHERMRILSAQAALACGDFEEVAGLFEHDFATNREGEVVLTDLWFALQEQRLARQLGKPVDDAIRKQAREEFPPPRNIDFRMVSEVE